MTLPGGYEDRQPIEALVERVMGRDPALGVEFIKSRAPAVGDDAIAA